MQLDGVFMVTTHSKKDDTTYLIGLNREMDQIVWRHDLFRYRCDDLVPECVPVFSACAGYDGI